MELLATESRGDLIESRHYGVICVYGRDGIAAKVGNTEAVCYFRSSSKPIQMLPVLIMGLDRKYGLDDRECTIMAGSNAGDRECLDVVKSLMEKTGITEDDMVLGARYPSSPGGRAEVIRNGEPERKIFHGCAPKHIGLMLLQRELTGSVKDYYLPDSACQRVVRYLMATFSGVPYGKIVIGIDGCGVPVFGVRCDRMARAYYCLANPEVLGERYTIKATERITSLMNKYPQLVRGNDYLCTVLNSYPNIVAKGGAGGVYCFGLKQEKLGVMLKLTDGTENSWQVIVAEILRQLSPEINHDTIAALEKRSLIGTPNGPILNSAGQKIGSMEPMFILGK